MTDAKWPLARWAQNNLNNLNEIDNYDNVFCLINIFHKSSHYIYIQIFKNKDNNFRSYNIANTTI